MVPDSASRLLNQVLAEVSDKAPSVTMMWFVAGLGVIAAFLAYRHKVAYLPIGYALLFFFLGDPDPVIEVNLYREQGSSYFLQRRLSGLAFASACVAAGLLVLHRRKARRNPPLE